MPIELMTLKYKIKYIVIPLINFKTKWKGSFIVSKCMIGSVLSKINYE